jgi:hypothetical protein
MIFQRFCRPLPPSTYVFAQAPKYPKVYEYPAFVYTPKLMAFMVYYKIGRIRVS